MGSMKQVLPNNIYRLLSQQNLKDQWDQYYQFCYDNQFHPRDIWVGFFIIAIAEDWVTEEQVLDHLDSIAFDQYNAVKKFSKFFDKINYKFDSLSQQVNGRALLLQSVGNPRAVMIYCTTLYRRLILKDQQIYNTGFAKKIRDILSPLCVSLNLGFIKWRLEDMAFKILHPASYRSLSDDMELTRSGRDRLVGHICVVLKKLFEARLLDPVDIRGRAKHLYGVYTKMKRKSVPSSEVYDKVALRILFRDVDACYQAVKIIRDQFKDIPEEYNDYISMPKANGYQSIHLAIYYDFIPVEIQVKTQEMHQFNQYGPAAHWLYKDYQAFGSKLNQVLKQQNFQSVVENKIFLLTPEGDIISLNKGALPLDFAYAVHSEVGHRCVGVLINDKMVSLHQALESGMTIKILTKRSQHPSIDWLNDDYTQCRHSRRHIRSWLRKHQVLKDQEKPKQTVTEKLNLPDIQIKPVPILKEAKVNTGMIAHYIAKCCQPMEPDEIVGYITRSRGMSIHRIDCEQIRSLNASARLRLQNISWDMLGSRSSACRMVCMMDCGRITRDAVINILKNYIIAADWYTDEQDNDIAKLVCILRIQDRSILANIKKTLLSITGVISFEET